MLKKPYLNTLKRSLHDYATKRHDVIKMSGDALHRSKRAIFAMHRGAMSEAETMLNEAKTLLKQVQIKFKKTPELLEEGAYRAATEEYVEAVIFKQFLETGVIGEEIADITLPKDVYLAGLCDVPGELYRYAIRAATAHDLDAVVACNELTQNIIEVLTEFEFTKYLRNKFDQAKQAAHKLEYVVYEVSIRG